MPLATGSLPSSRSFCDAWRSACAVLPACWPASVERRSTSSRTRSRAWEPASCAFSLACAPTSCALSRAWSAVPDCVAVIVSSGFGVLRRLPNAGSGYRAVVRSRPFARRPGTLPRSGGDHSRLGLVPGREDAGTVGGDGDRELEVGRDGPVLGVDRPAVVAHADHVAARRGHRLDGQDHALLEPGAGAGLAVVGDL